MKIFLQRIKRPGHLLAGIVRKFWFLFPNDAQYLKIIYRLEMGHKLDLNNPRTFTEKLQWLKINDRKPEYTRMVDKITAKDYVADVIGEQYIIPTLGIWDHFDEIDFSRLPNQFALKTNHGSGGSDVVICRNKDKLDIDAVRKKMESSLKRNGYNKYREWPYKNIQPKIFAEKMLIDCSNDDNQDIVDYKFFCFNGVPKFCQVIQNRYTKETIDFFDMDWNHQDFIGLNPMATHANKTPERPVSLNKMIEIAEKLSSNISFVRIDLYEIGETCFFGEITLYPASGFGKFTPKHYDVSLCEMLDLS